MSPFDVREPLSEPMARHELELAKITANASARLVARECVAALDGDWTLLPRPELVRRFAEAEVAEATAAAAVAAVAS